MRPSAPTLRGSHYQPVPSLAPQGQTKGWGQAYRPGGPAAGAELGRGRTFFRVISREAHQGGREIMSSGRDTKVLIPAQTYQLRVSGGISQNFLKPPLVEARYGLL